jgi:predicted porin
MKKSLIAFAVLSAFAASASAQSSVTVYGILDAGTAYTTNQNAAGDSKTSLDAGNMGTSRWGFKGVEDLGGGMKASFGLEATLGNDVGTAGGAGGTPLFDRLATVGLSGDFGAVNLGRLTNLELDAVVVTDPLGVAFAGTNPNVMFATHNNGAFFGSYGTNGTGAAARQNNSVKYQTVDFSGFSASLMHGFGEKAGYSTASTYTGLSGMYTDKNAFWATLAYSTSKDAAVAPAVSAELTSLYAGVKFKTGAIALKGTYSETKVDTINRKIDVIGLGVDYAMSPTTTLVGTYYNIKRSGATSGKADQFTGMAKYAFSKRTTVYAALTFAKAGTAAAVDTDLGGIVVAGNDDAMRTVVGINHSF